MSPSSDLLPITLLLVSIAKLMARIRDKAGNVYYSCLLVFQQEMDSFFTHLALLFGMPSSPR